MKQGARAWVINLWTYSCLVLCRPQHRDGQCHIPLSPTRYRIKPCLFGYFRLSTKKKLLLRGDYGGILVIHCACIHAMEVCPARNTAILTQDAPIHMLTQAKHFEFCGFRTVCVVKKDGGEKKIFDIQSLWPRDAVLHHLTRSTFVQVMACCLAAPSHHLNKCWLIVRVL